jgi:hypothetical protein
LLPQPLWLLWLLQVLILNPKMLMLSLICRRMRSGKQPSQLKAAPRELFSL